MSKKTYLAISVAVALGGVAAPPSFAEDTINGCVNNRGNLRVIAAGEECRRREEPISWGIQGPKGDTGEQGPVGPPGPVGEIPPEIDDIKEQIQTNIDAIADLEDAVCEHYAGTGTTPLPTFCPSKLVFVTSTLQAPDFGSVAGGDAICQSLADAVPLPGTYKAWLSSSTSSPATTFDQSAYPYELVDGTRIADDWSDLVDGTLENPINLDEYGLLPPPWTPGGGYLVWTGTDEYGHLLYDQPCGDWNPPGPSAAVGDHSTASSRWSGYTGALCGLELRLYCFQQ